MRKLKRYKTQLTLKEMSLGQAENMISDYVETIASSNSIEEAVKELVDIIMTVTRDSMGDNQKRFLKMLDKAIVKKL